MSVNKRLIIIYILMLLIPINVFATPDTFSVYNSYTGGNLGLSEYGERHVPQKFYHSASEYPDTYTQYPVYCTQYMLSVPKSCTKAEYAIDERVYLGIEKIINSNLAYVLKELSLDELLLKHYSTNRGHFKGQYINDVYTQARNEVDKFLLDDENKFSFVSSTLNFSYDSNIDKYVADATVQNTGEYNYACSSSADGTELANSVSYNGNKITVSVPRSEAEKPITLSCNLYKKIIKPVYYYCAGAQDVVIPGDTEETIYSDLITATGTFEDKGTVTLKKINTNDAEISGKNIGVQLYDGYDCNENNKNDAISSFTNGNNFTLEAGSYSIRETAAPTGYNLDSSCHNFTITPANDVAVTIKNVSTCVSDVLDLIDNNKANDKSERIRIYKKYNTNINSINNLKFTNLLNFNLEYVTGSDKEAFANSVCSLADCGEQLDFHCLTYQSSLSNDKRVNENNLSCYNDTITIDDNLGFCYTSFKFQNTWKGSNQPIESNQYYFLNVGTKTGQFVIKEDYLGKGIVSKECYFSNELNTTQINDKEYNGYVDSVKFNKLEMEKSSNPILKLDSVGSSKTNFKGSISVDYLMPEVYVEKMSGKTCTQEQILADQTAFIKKCKNIGRGLISNFNDGKFSESNIITIGDSPFVAVQFSIHLKYGRLSLSNNLYKTAGACVYSIQPEVITYDDKENGELEIEFRTIDTNNPFNRKTKSNWADGTNKSKNNKTVKEYITNSDVNNSYNRTGEGSLYTNQTDGTKRIILTPDLVQQIREYNAGKGTGVCANANPSYNDYTVHKEVAADGTETTTTNFFKCIGLTKVQ